MLGPRQIVIRKRQVADSFSGRGEDRIAERRCKGRDGGFAYASRRRFTLNDIRHDLARLISHLRHRVIVVVGMLDASLLERDLAIAFLRR